MADMLEMFRKPVDKRYVNPRFRAYGRARIDIARRASSRTDWDKMWKRSTFPFPFSWGESWKQCIEYKVDDFAAEVGFYIDILGLPVNAFDPDYAMFTSPGGEFYFSVVPAGDSDPSTPPEAIRIQFMVEDILKLAADLEQRGIVFEHWPAPCVEGSSLYIGYFRTPHGISIDLWGLVGDDFELAELEQPDTEEDVDGSSESSPSGSDEVVSEERGDQLAMGFGKQEDQEDASPDEEDEVDQVEENSQISVDYEYVYDEEE
jgi:catechol 2,3-dioxygenase-like lactoylglutathione lyase family enzyme